MARELPKTYDPKIVEDEIYQAWLDSGCFRAEPDPEKKPFSIVMPPPNVTGQLHMGHALDATLQDILTRFKRMQGYSALWLPGTDHAGIATQIKVEENLRVEEGLTRYDLGREKFLERVWDWKNKYGDRIVKQQMKLGASCDWSRSRFTMDEGCSKAVRETFCELYDKGLIYKGSRIINWCPHCLTALSDAEVEYADKPGHLWHLRYPLADGSGKYLVVATTRPETMMGDTGVAVNPADERYKDLVGKTCILPLMDREIPIVADEYVEMDFGTGCVKMTPAHDPNDFEVGLRHNLQTIRVLNDDGPIHDWCISRKLWWGHQIPAWYCDACGHINVSREDPTVCEKCGCTHLTREEDVLDTWFSSALWPFSTLGWPEQTKDLSYWYPTSVMVTGYDIIFFWVARMIFSGMEQMQKEPFHTVFIHGLVRDDKGRKMSKSLGNGIDPLEMAEKYGADALRFNLITGNSPGNDMRFYVEKCEAMRNFANKIWNASRYVLMNLTIDKTGLPPVEQLEQEDKWILSRLNTLIKEVTENLDSYELGVASAKVYDFIWDNYCDWYIELTKARLYSEDAASKETAQQVLVYVLDQILRLLHPFMPFITEEIWQAIPHEGDFLMKAQWPVYSDALHFPAEEASMESVMNAIRAVRNRRADLNVPPSRKSHLYVVTEKGDIFRQGAAFMTRLAYASELTVSDTAPEGHADMVSAVTGDAALYMPMNELVDVEKELQRLAKEIEKAEKNIAGLKGKLGNENFVARAPEQVVQAERDKLQKAESLLQQLKESEARLKK